MRSPESGDMKEEFGDVYAWTGSAWEMVARQMTIHEYLGLATISVWLV